MRSSIALIALSLAGFGALGCVRETVSCADNPSAVCPEIDTGPSDIDASTDARVRTDANTDAFSVFDAWAPDAGTDAWAPDAYIVPDGNCGCSGNLICVAGAPGGCGCIDNTQCVGNPGGPACDTTTHTCVPCVDNSTCTTAAAPACDVATHSCVACVDSSTCTAALGGPVCDVPRHTCVGCLDAAMDCPGALLDACVANTCVGCDDATDCADDPGTLRACVSNTCRQCDSTDDCGSTAAARCNTTMNMCTGCTADTDCTHLSGTPACNEGTGTCVPCMPDNESLCGANSCNPTTRTCTGTPRNSRLQCLSCIADSECAAGLSCTEAVTGGFYCFPNRPGTGCSAPYFTSRPTAPTASGAVADICRLRSATCEAMLDYPNQSTEGADQCGTGGSSDAACGAPGVADGACRRAGDVVTGAFRCTYRCLGSDDCRGSGACVDFGTDADSNTYCVL